MMLLVVINVYNFRWWKYNFKCGSRASRLVNLKQMIDLSNAVIQFDQEKKERSNISIRWIIVNQNPRRLVNHKVDTDLTAGHLLQAIIAQQPLSVNPISTGGVHLQPSKWLRTPNRSNPLP